MSENEQAWLTRANPANMSYVEKFLEEGFYAIGWGDVGDLSLADYEEIKKLIGQFCDYIQTPGEIRIPLSALHHFRNSMHIGDYILMPGVDSSKIYVGQIIGDYYFNEEDSLIAHRRKVSWSSTIVERNNLSEELKRPLKSRRTIAHLDEYYQEIADFFEDTELIIYSTVTYSAELKIRSNQTITLSGIPKDITPEEASVICSLVKGLVV